jgi:kumamolisin
MVERRAAVRGSERSLENARIVGTPSSSDHVEVSVVLRRRAPLELQEPLERLAREAFEARYGADPADVARVEAFAARYDLTVAAVDLARRTITLSGTVAAMNEAFGTTLALFQSEQGTFRGRTGALSVPLDVHDAIVGVFGLDNRPQAHTRCRRNRNVDAIGPRATSDTSYTPIDVAKLYQFPTDATGANQTVAIVELGGGYRSADLRAYFTQLGLASTPGITAISVDGARNAPTGDPNSADGEVLLDVEIVGAIARDAKIAVYFAPNTDQGFLDAITTAVHDKVRKPSVVSISWGGAESSWTQQSLQAFDQAFQDAAVIGVSVFCASGDSGSSDGVSDGLAHVDFPASSPHVVACGGTRLEGANGSIQRETVWNAGAAGGATGGGVSEIFPLPDYQKTANVPASVNASHFKGRGVPDVAGDADPATGYQVHVDGQDAVFGGTSAVAPLWAAFTALLNQKRPTPIGYLNPLIYASGARTAFRDITTGTNGAYTAAPGWDACTGLGSPRGGAFSTI